MLYLNYTFDYKKYATCSKLLRNAIFAQTARFTDDERTWTGSTGKEDSTIKARSPFIAIAKMQLSSELDGTPSIPLIQALILWSATECANGRFSQAWIYSGYERVRLIS